MFRLSFPGCEGESRTRSMDHTTATKSSFLVSGREVRVGLRTKSRATNEERGHSFTAHFSRDPRYPVTVELHPLGRGDPRPLDPGLE